MCPELSKSSRWCTYWRRDSARTWSTGVHQLHRPVCWSSELRCRTIIDGKQYDQFTKRLAPRHANGKSRGLLEFLLTKVLQYKGYVPWKDSWALLQDIDVLPSGPAWSTVRIPLKGLYHYILFVFIRNPVEVVRNLIGNPLLKDFLHYAPQRVWTSSEMDNRIFDEMWTGERWWRMQVSCSYSNYILELTLA